MKPELSPFRFIIVTLQRKINLSGHSSRLAIITAINSNSLDGKTKLHNIFLSKEFEFIFYSFQNNG